MMKRILRVCLLLLVISCQQNTPTSPTTVPIVDLEAVNIVNPGTQLVYEKLNFGNGYNSATGSEYLGVMNFEGMDTSAEIQAGARGNSGYIELNITDSKEELKESLNISAKVDLDFKIYGVSSSNSLKVAAYNETQFNAFTQNAVITAQYVNEPLTMINPAVKQSLIELARRDPDAFMRRCGDMFVSRIYTGGELNALYTLSSTNRSEKAKNDVFFSSVNSYLGNAMNVSVSSSSINESAVTNQSIRSKIITQGGQNTPTSSSLKDFLVYAGTFKEGVAADNRAVTLYVALSPYESLADFPKINFNKIRVRQRLFIEHATAIYDQLDRAIHSAHFVNNNPSYFEVADLVQADSIINKYADLQSLLVTRLQNCRSDFDNCLEEQLELFEAINPYHVEIDLPEWKGTEVSLAVNASEGEIEVIDDTGNGPEGQVNIQGGDLELRRSAGKPPVRHSGTFSKRRTIYKNKVETASAGFLKRATFDNVYHTFYFPYYRIRFYDAATNNLLEEKVWYGNAFKVPKNVKVTVQLINPNGFLNYSNAKPLGQKLEKALNYKRQPYFSLIRAYDTDNLPKAIYIAGNEVITEKSPSAPLQASGIEVLHRALPKASFKDGYYIYSQSPSMDRDSIN